MKNQEFIFNKLQSHDDNYSKVIDRVSKLEEKVEHIEKRRTWQSNLISLVLGGIIVGFVDHFHL